MNHVLVPRVARIPLRVSASAALSAALAAALVAEERTVGVTADRRDTYVRTWARGMLRTLRVDPVLDASSERASGDRPHLAIANHRSTLDIFLMLHLFGGHLLARGDMEHWPIVGKMAQMAGTLFVDRSDAASGAASIRKVTELLGKRRTVGVFPEGTTFDDDEVRPFHAGAFMAIARVRGSITPVGIAYADRSAHYVDEPIGDHFRRVLTAPVTRVGVVIGAPIVADGTPIKALRDRSHAAVQALVLRARALVAR